MLAPVVDQRRFNAAPLLPVTRMSPGMSVPVLPERWQPTSALVELRLDDAFRGNGRVGLQVEDFSLQQDRLK